MGKTTHQIQLLLVVVHQQHKMAFQQCFCSNVMNLEWSSIHSLFGFIAFLLTIFQPISALFRCHPDSSARVVFNVLHAFTGYIGWLCALIAICIACVHFGLFANTSAATVLIIVFLVLLGIVALIMQIVAIQKGHQQQQEQHGTIIYIVAV
ncbi:hypothetical protein niasHT_008367 [Heterodera trifolii]|uniref:Cytochrome b561 domain-containing protein n=1 Tax=Heterodera trifolii TaxID=157864 RepID=A0ABD2M620_9BILA